MADGVKDALEAIGAESNAGCYSGWWGRKSSGYQYDGWRSTNSWGGSSWSDCKPNELEFGEIEEELAAEFRKALDDAVKAGTGWKPGKDCGRFGEFHTSLVQVILTNLHLNACRLTSKLAKELLSHLLPKGAAIPENCRL